MENRLKLNPTSDRNDGAKPPASNKLRMASTVAALFIAVGAGLQMMMRQENQADVGTVRVTDCDRLAAHPSDTQKIAPGIHQADVDIPRARKACEAALKQYPNNGRLLYQYGRTFFYNNEKERGIEIFRQADATGYAQGQFVLGLILVQGNGTEPDTCAGGTLWVKAARQRHLYSKIYLANNWLDNMFTDCKLTITEQELDGMVSAAEELADTQTQHDDVAMLRKNWEARKR
jgi:tetratricopeptide (TPR) repeat protein